MPFSARIVRFDLAKGHGDRIGGVLLLQPMITCGNPRLLDRSGCLILAATESGMFSKLGVDDVLDGSSC
jgi:hypothetical protein